MWGWLEDGTDKAEAKLKKRLGALGDDARETVAALNLSHNTSSPCWETWRVYVCWV